jgi:hypothetical protein
LPEKTKSLPIALPGISDHPRFPDGGLKPEPAIVTGLKEYQVGRLVPTISAVPESGEGNAIEGCVSCRPILRLRQPNDPPLQVRLVPHEGELFAPAYPLVDTDEKAGCSRGLSRRTTSETWKARDDISRASLH